MFNKKRIFTMTILTVFLLTIIYYLLTSSKVAKDKDKQDISSTPPLQVQEVVEKIEYTAFANSPYEYEISIPTNMMIDNTLSSAFTRIYNKDLNIKISKERCPYGPSAKNSPSDEDSGIEMYFRVYLNRFILNPEYQKANSITIVDDTWKTFGDYKTRFVSFYRTPAKGSNIKSSAYVFAYIITGKQEFYNFFFKTTSLDKNMDTINSILQSFKKIPKDGAVMHEVDYKPVLPKWNSETKAFYDKLKNTDKILWGYFYPWALTEDYTRVASIEEKLDYKFHIILHYLYLGHDFPLEGMNNAYDRGQIVELTMQLASANNDNNPTHNINFDVLDGLYDDEIRRFARSAKEFKHPFLFRLNNEMNTDWCQYSGVLLLSDSDLYIDIWRRFYDIFEEEGVDNAIWIYNPNGSSYPPTNWNSHIAYYPGNEYAQVLGITGYNAGTYFKNVTGERWQSFDEIYSPMAQKYRQFYKDFPWIITEFASSSVGGDKTQWIHDMFLSLPKYPEIKAAVWWGYTDYDYREGKTDIPARRYWLDEKDEYLEEFKKGL